MFQRNIENNFLKDKEIKKIKLLNLKLFYEFLIFFLKKYIYIYFKF
jgi:hypothetical protein